MESAWDASAKYNYSSQSTIHNPQEIGTDGNIHTWTLELNGQYFRVTREVWEAYYKDNAALREAGEKMAERLRHINDMKWLSEQSNEFNASALAEWEAANK